MNRSRDLVDAYYNRDITLHKPGVVPKSSRRISPITSNRHKYELKQRIWPQRTVESWFESHSPDERRVVYSFLDTLYQADNTTEMNRQHEKVRNPKAYPRVQTAVNRLPCRHTSLNGHHESRASKRDLGEILQSLESFRLSSSAQEKSVQTSAIPPTVPLPDVTGSKTDLKRPSTSIVRQPESSTDETSNTNNKSNRRYLSHTWRVINPRDDVEQNVRPEHNVSSFFNYTKKSYPEYFFIHPDWY